MSDAVTKALRLLEGAGTWHELRRSLDEQVLTPQLSANDTQTLLDAWHRRQASRLDDAALARELAFWADGGTFDTHLDGWQATRPAALVEDAARRGWFVRRLASGAVVNPPQGKPLMLKSLDVVASS
ncbi:MAG: hypothetical protein WCZ23_11730 [Rhodospirillaceae bacterium]